MHYVYKLLRKLEWSYKKGHRGEEENKKLKEEGPFFMIHEDMKFTGGFYEVMDILRPWLASAISYHHTL